MDGRVEPLRGYGEDLRERGESFFALVAIALPLILVAVPAFRAAGRLLVESDLSSLSAVFWKIVLRSLAVTFFHSALAAVVAGALGAILGVALAFVPGPLGRRCSDFARSLGTLVFVFPGVLTALLVLGWARSVSWLPQTGIPAIVFAHVLVNAAFLTSNINERVRAFFASGGLDRFEAAATLGARGLAPFRAALGPVVRAELSIWLPLVFLWSFSAFSTVVILGGSPETANLEVILFYSFSSADDSARVLALMILQLAIAWAAASFGERVGARARSEHGSDRDGLALVGSRFAFPVLLAPAISLLLLVPVLPVLSSPLRLMASRSEAPAGFLPAALWTLALAVAAAGFSILFFEALSRAGSRSRRRVACGLGLSTTFLAVAWVSAGLEDWMSSAPMQLLAAGLAVSVVQWPLMAFWVERRVRAMPLETWEAGATLGAPAAALHARVLRPQLADVRWKVALAAFLGAAGELSVSTIFLRDVDTVALLSRRLASRYDFSGALWVTSFLVLVTAVAFLLQRKRRTA
jgi:ABC-type Fe3+ transport system permease subunit